ncbi:MAG: phage portal protein [[Clostridium] scindens]
MEMSFGSRLKHAWNAFTGNVQMNYRDLGMSYSYRADRPRMSRGNERSIVTSVYNRIALDVAALNVQHVRLDENGRFLSVIDDGLNNCLTLEANVDQTARSFIQDVVISMFDEGSVAIVPVDTTTDPNVSGSYDIQSLRVGQILDWYPQYIRTRVYNEQTGRKEDIVVPKSAVAIIENPLYAVINEPNSTMQRLIRKLNLLDVIDEQSGSGKLDLIIQLPYVIKTEARRQQAENRRKDIESQLSGSKYGIAYTDGTEHITQLNRSVNNNLMSQIEYLTSMLYSQLGITQSILDGTADEKTMLNYNNRTIEPIISAIVDEMKRKFLTKTARSQRQSISFFRDPFKLVPVNEIAEIADKFTRNEIMTSNEIRQVVGMKPSDDPRADELRNKNLSESSGSDQQSEETPITTDNSVEESASDLDDKISKQKSKK